MKQWGYDRRIQIDQSIYLKQETVKAIHSGTALQSWGRGGPSSISVQGAYNLGVPCMHDSRDREGSRAGTCTVCHGKYTPAGGLTPINQGYYTCAGR